MSLKTSGQGLPAHDFLDAPVRTVPTTMVQGNSAPSSWRVGANMELSAKTLMFEVKLMVVNLGVVLMIMLKAHILPLLQVLLVTFLLARLVSMFMVRELVRSLVSQAIRHQWAATEVMEMRLVVTKEAEEKEEARDTSIEATQPRLNKEQLNRRRPGTSNSASSWVVTILPTKT